MLRSSRTKMEQPTIGDRVEVEGYIGTILFIGEIPGTKGTWLGVEWDDPSRGKHDGVHEGIRYFTTKYPSSGSFIRPQKANFGRSFLKAVHDRYGSEYDQPNDLYVISSNKKVTNIEFVGAESIAMKQSQLNQLQKINLHQCQVKDAGEPDELQNTVPSVEELDLSKNLLKSWNVVAEICKQIHNLQELNLSENRLQFPDAATKLSPAFPNVHIMCLNKMDYTWDEVLRCSEMMQDLHQLYVCYNNINLITGVGLYLQQIQLIDLEGNHLSSWDEVLRLGDLPCLQKLILSNTNISRIYFPDVEYGQTTKYFPKLSALSVSDNKISEWSSINELGKLASLTELMFRRNPLIDVDPFSARLMIIAKLQNLRLANMSEITKDERKDAEIFYLKTFGKEWLRNRTSETFINEHPQYETLVNKYGPLEEGELNVKSTALKNCLISVTLKSKCSTKDPVKKKLPITMTVQKLKGLAQRLYKADPITMKLTYTSHKMPGTEIELEMDQKEIGFYSIEDGDTIHISW